MLKMSNKGITLVSLSIYIVAMLVIVAIISAITTFFYGNVVNMSDEAKLIAEFDKFNSYMIDETKIEGNLISELAEENKKIAFNSGNIYKIEAYGIYRNDTRIFEASMDLVNSYFYKTEENNKEIVGIKIVTNENYSNTVEYILQTLGISNFDLYKVISITINDDIKDKDIFLYKIVDSNDTEILNFTLRKNEVKKVRLSYGNYKIVEIEPWAFKYEKILPINLSINNYYTDNKITISKNLITNKWFDNMVIFEK